MNKEKVKKMIGITVCRERYEKWWLDKYCRPANRSNQPFKRVVKIDILSFSEGKRSRYWTIALNIFF